MRADLKLCNRTVETDLRVAQLRAGASEKNTEIILSILNSMLLNLNIHESTPLSENMNKVIKTGFVEYDTKMQGLQTRKKSRFDRSVDVDE